MSEHIKTGEEIHNQFLFTSKYKDEYYVSLLKEKWARVSWLKEQIKHREGLPSTPDEHLMLHWFLSLLSQEKKE